MGTSKSKDSTYHDPTLNSTLIDQTKQCKFYRNQRGQQYEKYKIKHKGNYDFQNRYQYRIKNASPYLVQAYSAKASNNAFGCASGQEYQVVTERIPIRLCELSNLSGYESLNMAHKSLKGFQQIFKSQGALLVKDTMIGVNKHNDVKVWMNSNFAVNDIEQQPISYGVLTDQQKQSTMVDNVIQLINSRATRDPQWTEFVEQKYRNGRIGFDQAIWLCQNIATAHKISLTDNTHNPQNVQQFHNESETVHHQQTQPNLSRQMVTSIPSDLSALKNTNQTVSSSAVVTNPMTILANHAKFTNEVLPPPVVQQSKAGNYNMTPAPSSISAMKNRVISGGTLTRKNQVPIQIGTSTSMHMEPVVNSSFKVGSNPPPIHHALIKQQPRTFIQPPPQPQIINNPPRNNFLMDNRNMRQQTSVAKPRPVSQGKPIITFGNKQIPSSTSSASQYSQFSAIRPSPATPTFSSIAPSPSALVSVSNTQPQSITPLNAVANLVSNSVNQSNTTSNKPVVSQPKQLQSRIPAMPSTQVIPAAVSAAVTAIPLNNNNSNNNINPNSINQNINVNQNINTRVNNQVIEQQQAVAQFTQGFIKSNQIASGQQMVFNQVANIVGSNNNTNTQQQQLETNANNKTTTIQQNIKVQKPKVQQPVVKTVQHHVQQQQQDYLWSVFKQSQPQHASTVVNNNNNNNTVSISPQIQTKQVNNSINSNVQVNRTIATNYDTNVKDNKNNYEQQNHERVYSNSNQQVHDTPQFGRMQNNNNNDNDKAKRQLFNQYANINHDDDNHIQTGNNAAVSRALSEDLLLAHEEQQLNLLKKSNNNNNNNANNQVQNNNNIAVQNKNVNVNLGQELNQRINIQIIKQVQQQKQQNISTKNNNNNSSNILANIDPKIKIAEQNTNSVNTNFGNTKQERQQAPIASTTIRSSQNTNVIKNNNNITNNEALVINNNSVPKSGTNTTNVVVKDEKNFKKAVQQNASNIRMQSSKITIRNSSDLKGLISYKDLRDLLQSVRKPVN